MKTADPRAAALETIRRCAEGLARGADADERARLVSLHEAATQVLEQFRPARPATLRRIEQFRKLETQLGHLDPGERASAIRERMNICRSVYYQLRRRAHSPHTNAD